jgi:hypothetical protein
MTNRQLKRLEVSYANVLVTIFELMLRGGMRPHPLLELCGHSLGRAKQRLRVNPRRERGDLLTAALVLDAWHRNRRYLTPTGAPKPLRLFGPAPSVEALVRAQRIRKHASDVAHQLRAVRLIVPCRGGLYRPTSDSAVISSRNPLIVQHATRALSTLLETVGRNMNRAATLPPLIERFAEVPDLPRKHIAAFQRFTQSQGRTFVTTVNDWLEARRPRKRARRASNGTVRAGIHTYAYVATNQERRSAAAIL